MNKSMSFGAIILSIFVFFISLGCGEQSGTENISQSDECIQGSIFRGNDQRTGYYESTLGNKPVLKWKFRTRGVVFSTPSVCGSYLYFGSLDGHLYAIDVLTGNEKWQFETGMPVTSSPAVNDGKVYFGSGFYLYALDAESGQEIWKIETSEGLSVASNIDNDIPGVNRGVASSPLADSGRVYFGTDGGEFFAVDSRTGEAVWSFKAKDPITLSPARGDGNIFFADESHLYAVDEGSGSTKWVFDTTILKLNSAPAVYNGNVYFDDGQTVYSLNSVNGSINWKAKMLEEGSFYESPTVDGNSVFIGDNENYYSFDIKTGEPKWTQRKDHDGSSVPSSATTDLIIFGSNLGNIYAFDKQNGEERWSFKVRGAIGTSPVIVNGIVYFGSADGYMYALELM